MADFDFQFGGTSEESAEIKRLNAEVYEDPDNFEHWEKLVRAAETLEGGLNRNSSPQAITTTRDIYDRFLARFPLLFGYWKKYADMEFSIAGTEAAEMIYERGVASITNSVDLWTDFCSFKVETSHDPDVIRELFERGSVAVGLDFLAHPFWDKYIEFEERHESHDNIFSILKRVIHIPMHQYARYFERFRNMAHTQHLTKVIPEEQLGQFRAEIDADGGGFGAKSEIEAERELRTKIDNYHLTIFTKTQNETNKRWTYESEVKRPYFHVTELDHHQLANWRKYLDFEEAEGDYTRILFLYERCLVTCAYYDDFWFRYARWMLAQDGKEEEVRNIYARATAYYVPISRPGIRLQWAYFEEMCGRISLARDIHEAILLSLPSHVETIISLGNLERRQDGLQAAINVYEAQIALQNLDIYAKAALVVEWAHLLWKIKGSVEAARLVFENNKDWYLNSRHFWLKYLEFEIEQPTDAESEENQYERIKKVFDYMRTTSSMSSSTIKDLSHIYMTYLQQRGGKEAMKEFMIVDREVKGPLSVIPKKPKLAKVENGPAEAEVEALICKGEERYTKFFYHATELTSANPQALAHYQ